MRDSRILFEVLHSVLMLMCYLLEIYESQVKLKLKKREEMERGSYVEAASYTTDRVASERLVNKPEIPSV